MKIDIVTKVVLETTQAAGYAVTIKANQDSATDSKRGERFIVRFDNPNRLYDAVVQPAQRVGKGV